MITFLSFLNKLLSKPAANVVGTIERDYFVQNISFQLVAIAASFGHLALELQVGEELAPTLDAWHSLTHLLVQVKEMS